MIKAKAKKAEQETFSLVLTLLKSQKYLKEDLIKWYTESKKGIKFSISQDILNTSMLFYEENVVDPSINLSTRAEDIFT